MSRLIDKVLGFIASFLLFSSTSEAKGLPSTEYLQSVTDLAKVELISKPSPLILQQAEPSANSLTAGHRSHSSHSSHASHRSHASHYSGSYSSPETSTKESAPVSTKDSEPTTSSSLTPKKTSSPSVNWQSSAEWKNNACVLFRREVQIVLKNNKTVEGIVTGCKQGSMEIYSSAGNHNAMHRVKSSDVKSLVWK
jgi:His-Xaa-Ser repeat protein HxsA